MHSSYPKSEDCIPFQTWWTLNSDSPWPIRPLLASFLLYAFALLSGLGIWIFAIALILLVCSILLPPWLTRFDNTPAQGEPFNSFLSLTTVAPPFLPHLAALIFVAAMVLLPAPIKWAVGIFAVAILCACSVHRTQAAFAHLDEPLGSYQVLEFHLKRRTRPFSGSLFIHALLCLSPWIVALAGAWLETPALPVVRQPKKRITYINAKPPKPAPPRPKTAHPLLTAKTPVISPPPSQSPVKDQKIDQSKTVIAFEADSRDALPQVLAMYGAKVALIEKSDAEDYFSKKDDSLVPEALFDARDWSPLAPSDLAGNYLLLLNDPERCAPIRGVLHTASAKPGLLVYLVFPLEVQGFAEELAQVIREEASRKAPAEEEVDVTEVTLAFVPGHPGVHVTDLRVGPHHEKRQP